MGERIVVEADISLSRSAGGAGIAGQNTRNFKALRKSGDYFCFLLICRLKLRQADVPLAPVTEKPRCDIGYAAVAVVFARQLAHKIAENIDEPAVRIVGTKASAVFVVALLFYTHIPYEPRHGLFADVGSGIVEIDSENRLIPARRYRLEIRLEPLADGVFAAVRDERGERDIEPLHAVGHAVVRAVGAVKRHEALQRIADCPLVFKIISGKAPERRDAQRKPEQKS